MPRTKISTRVISKRRERAERGAYWKVVRQQHRRETNPRAELGKDTWGGGCQGVESAPERRKAREGRCQAGPQRNFLNQKNGVRTSPLGDARHSRQQSGGVGEHLLWVRSSVCLIRGLRGQERFWFIDFFF